MSSPVPVPAAMFSVGRRLEQETEVVTAVTAASASRCRCCGRPQCLGFAGVIGRVSIAAGL